MMVRKILSKYLYLGHLFSQGSYSQLFFITNVPFCLQVRCFSLSSLLRLQAMFECLLSPCFWATVQVLHFWVCATVSVSRACTGKEEVNSKSSESWVRWLMTAVGGRRSFPFRSHSQMWYELVIPLGASPGTWLVSATTRNHLSTDCLYAHWLSYSLWFLSVFLHLALAASYLLIDE